MEDGYYENRYVPPPPMYLEISPAVTEMPVIEGDSIVGTPRAKFSVDILIHNVNPMDELFLVQLEIKYRSDLITCIWIDEGTFMNNPVWAPDGTYDNMTILNEPINATFSKSLWWIMISPNGTGYWPPP
jgi:hypothetical protein